MLRLSEIRYPKRTHGATVRAWLGINGQSRQPTVEQPLRSELFSVEQLRQHAVALAGGHELDPFRGPDRLLPRLAKNEAILLEAYTLITGAVAANRRLEPAGEWLL